MPKLTYFPWFHVYAEFGYCGPVQARDPLHAAELALMECERKKGKPYEGVVQIRDPYSQKIFGFLDTTQSERRLIENK